MDKKVIPNEGLTRKLNTIKKICHEFMKNAKKAGGGTDDWINKETLRRVETENFIKRFFILV